MSPENPTAGPSIVDRMADEFNIDRAQFDAALQRVAGCDGSTRADFVVLLMLANQYKLNPIRREIGLMPTKHGPRVYVSFDGWITVITSHPDYISHDFIEHWSGGERFKGDLFAVEVKLYSKKREAAKLGPYHHIEFMVECRVTSRSGPWDTHPFRMLHERAIAQGARFLWNLYVPTADEWERQEASQHTVEVPVSDEPFADVPAEPVAEQPRRGVAPRPALGPGRKVAKPALPAPQPTEVIDLTQQPEAVPVEASPEPAAAQTPTAAEPTATTEPTNPNLGAPDVLDFG